VLETRKVVAVVTKAARGVIMKKEIIIAKAMTRNANTTTTSSCVEYKGENSGGERTANGADEGHSGGGGAKHSVQPKKIGIGQIPSQHQYYHHHPSHGVTSKIPRYVVGRFAQVKTQNTKPCMFPILHCAHGTANLTPSD
jgi:hypothetical protein